MQKIIIISNNQIDLHSFLITMPSIQLSSEELQLFETSFRDLVEERTKVSGLSVADSYNAYLTLNDF